MYAIVLLNIKYISYNQMLQILVITQQHNFTKDKNKDVKIYTNYQLLAVVLLSD